MKNKQHIIDCLRGKNPVRDLILVEKRIPHAYAVPLGTEYSANILSLTGLSKPLQVDYFTSLSGLFKTTLIKKSPRRSFLLKKNKLHITSTSNLKLQTSKNLKPET